MSKMILCCFGQGKSCRNERLSQNIEFYYWEQTARDGNGNNKEQSGRNITRRNAFQ